MQFCPVKHQVERMSWQVIFHQTQALYVDNRLVLGYFILKFGGA